MRDSKISLQIGDIVQPDGTWRIDEADKDFGSSLSRLFQMCGKSDYEFYADCKKFTDEFGDEARLMVTDIVHSKAEINNEAIAGAADEKIPAGDVVTLSLLDNSGKYNSLAPVFEALVNFDFPEYPPELTDVKTVDHYPQTYIPVCGPK